MVKVIPLGLIIMVSKETAWKQCLCKILEGQTKSIIMVFLILANIKLCVIAISGPVIITTDIIFNHTEEIMPEESVTIEYMF